MDDESKRIIEGMNARLLKTEGELLAVAQVLQAIVSIENVTTGILKVHLEEILLRIKEQVPPDAPTAIYFQAASEMMASVLDENARHPGFTVIKGGKE